MSTQIHSMTGYATIGGQAEGLGWDWDIRSVNARGLDIRLRLADGFEPLEAKLRNAIGAALTRGSVSVTLKIGQRALGQDLALNEAALDRALGLLGTAAARAEQLGVQLAPASAAELLHMRGVMEQGGTVALPDGAMAAAGAQIAPLLDALLAMRASEGAALKAVLTEQTMRMDELTAKAHACAEIRAASAGALLASRVQALLDAGAPPEGERYAQELALLAVKTDITEELDRLSAHIAAAQDLLAAGGPVGRRLDFLMQEFNREANTLCSKAQSTELTTIGLDMKLIIDQMREQVQNLE